MEQELTESTPCAVDASALSGLLSLLELERVDRDLFRARNPLHARSGSRPLFGGQVAAHALRAAALTVEGDHQPHSLHGYFLRPGRSGTSTMLRVDRLRDGRSFTTRSVVALQDDRVIFTLTASFHKDEPGSAHRTPRAGELSTPDALRAQGHESRPHWFPDSPFEVIEIPHEQLEGAPRRAMWIRTRGRLPLDRVLHACVLTYLSDMGPLGAVRRALDAAPRQGHGASLDHSVWFHRQVRADQWLAFDVRAVAGGGARGLAIGTVHDEFGAHAASLTQEVLVRPST